MNLKLLHTDIQKFITQNLKSDTSDLILKGISFDGVTSKAIVEQIESKRRSEHKLPRWFFSKNIYYPNKLNIEQTSSEITANYKAHLVAGNSLIDVTGGFGVDAYYFSKQVENVIHCEIDTPLSNIVKHNYKALNTTNIECLNEDGITALKRLDVGFDWIFIDPSRRNDAKQKVFLLSDCAPNIKTFQGLFLKYASNVMVKTSPLLDIKATLLDLNHAKELHIVAVNNEVKELLWILERNFEGNLLVKTRNIQKNNSQSFDFLLENENEAQANYSEPLAYLYEPNTAVLKAGAFNTIATSKNIKKLHKHSHLYTSDILIEFPGRTFKIETKIPFNKKLFSKQKITKANVTTRNFPLSVGDIRKKLKIKDGGYIYLFFTTDLDGNKIILVCSKV